MGEIFKCLEYTLKKLNIKETNNTIKRVSCETKQISQKKKNKWLIDTGNVLNIVIYQEKAK